MANSEPRSGHIRSPALIAAASDWLVLCLLLLVLCLPLAGCTGEGQAAEAHSRGAAQEGDGSQADDADENGAEAQDEDLVPVETVTLERGPIEAVLRFSTNLEAESEVQVYSQAARLVTELLVEEGDQVARGQPLLRLQDAEQRSNLSRVKSQLEKARREHQRQTSLFERELISEQAFNEAVYELEQLELSFADAQRELSYTEVRAPISGIVTNRLVNLGDHITINQHLFDIVDFDTIVARIYVPERELKRLSTGQKARLFSDSLGGEARHGQVKRIAPIVDPRSGTVKVTVGIPRYQGLLPGMYVEVELVIDTHAEALLVPKRAVVYDNERAFVFRLTEEMKVERLPIEARLEDRDFIEPVTGRLEAGDRIVVAGQAGLKNGARVRLVKADETPETAAAGAGEEA